MRKLLLGSLLTLLCACPESRRRPPPPTTPAETTAEETAPVVIAPTTLEALQAAYEADLAAFKQAQSLESWEQAMASLDALREAAEGALEILEDYEPVERDELVRARPANQQQEPAKDAGSKSAGGD